MFDVNFCGGMSGPNSPISNYACKILYKACVSNEKYDFLQPSHIYEDIPSFPKFPASRLSSPWFQAGSIHWTSTIIYVFLFFKRKTMKNPLDRFFPSFLTTLIAVFLFFCVLICAVPSSQASSSASARRVVPTCSPAWNSSATRG